MNHRSIVFAAVALLVMVAALHRALTADASALARHYHLDARWSVDGDGGWDDLCADTAARRLYVSHGTRVEVLDLDRGTPVARIDSTLGVHAIAIAPDLGRGFISCGRESSVVVFDLAHVTVLRRIPIGARNPDAILYEPHSHRVLAFNGGSGNATVIDAATGDIAGAIDLGGRPEFAVADGRGEVFANIEDTSELVAIDPRALRVDRRWPLAPGEGPSGLAMDRGHRRLFSVCGNHTMVISDADRGAVIDSVPIGGGPDGVVFDASRGVVVSSNGEGTITVVREEPSGRFAVAATDSTERGARTMTLDGRTGRLFLCTASFGPPPAPTAERPRPRPSIVPGTFRVLVLAP